jgi:hypothetical protein
MIQRTALITSSMSLCVGAERSKAQLAAGLPGVLDRGPGTEYDRVRRFGRVRWQ